MCGAALPELWRWAQSSAAVHLVSRKLQDGSLVLHDAVLARSFLRGRSEELAFLEDSSLAQRLRRGLSFVEFSHGSGRGQGTVLARRGLPKFHDLDIDTFTTSLREASSPTIAGLPRPEERSASSRTQEAVAAQLASKFHDAWQDGKSITMWKLYKANGENAQVSFFAPTQQWVVCSKNVSLLVGDADEVSRPQWSDHRYRFARSIANVWFGQLGRMAGDLKEDLRKSLASHTLVGELIGGSSHLVQYAGGHDIRWFAVVPHGGTAACWPPPVCATFLARAGLPGVTAQLVGSQTGYTSQDDLLEALRQCAEATETASLSTDGEGCVLYFVANTALPHGAAASETLGLGKLKTAEYRLVRKVREKAKHFARGGGAILVEDVVAGYHADVASCRATARAVQEYGALLGKLCRLIYSEGMSPEQVDESFLDVVDKARSFEGDDAPKPASPVLCLVVPPCLADAQVMAALRSATGGDNLGRVTSEGLAALWHRSSASHSDVYVNHVPADIERILHTAACEPPSKSRRLVTMEERHSRSMSGLPEQLTRRRGLFVFWGWSDAGIAQALDMAAHRIAPSAASREACKFFARPRQQKALLLKWRHQARRLRSKLPSSNHACFAGVPTVRDCRAMFSISGRFDGLRRTAGSTTAQGLIIVMLPVGLPGMGKTSLMESLFFRCQSIARHAFHQGVLQPGAGAHGTGDSRSEWQLSAVSMLSSDGFSGSEIKAAGLEADQCSEAEFAQCRRRAGERYKDAVRSFLEFVRADLAAQLPGSASDDVARYVLILDKNYPPASLQREVEQLRAATPAGCDMRVKSVVLTAAASPRPRWHPFEEAEATEFGKWDYAWSPEALAECCARLLLRSSHETLTSNDTALFVLLSFFRLHRAVHTLGRARGAEVMEVPLLSCAPELASWGDLASDEEESIWRRFEVRALLREALLVIKPFGDPRPSAPLVSALVKCLVSSGLQTPHSTARSQHANQCTEMLMSSIRSVVLGESAPPVPGVRYVALSVEEHYHQLTACLNAAQQAMCAGEAAEAFPSPPFQSPPILHVTTLYVGGAKELPEDRRELLLSSRRLHAQGAKFECAVTHIVCARGALAVAVVDADRLRSTEIPMEKLWPHVTLRTRPPWKPKHSNDVIEAAAPLLTSSDQASEPLKPGTGVWLHAARVGNGVLDIFVFRLPESLVLPQNPLYLL